MTPTSDPKPLLLRPTKPQVLLAVLRQAQALGSKGVIAFDLDGTLFTNYPRWVRIVREYGQARNIPTLASCHEACIDGFSMRRTLIQSGLDPAFVSSIEKDAYAFWEQRFYTSDYCTEDRALEGAVHYLAQVQQTGVHVAYVTGRHEAMVAGSIECLRKERMPIPDDRRVHMLAKPTFSMSDDTWKELAYAHLRQLGELVAAFDNEPTHINSYHLAFPRAQAVHLLTNDSGRGVVVHPEIPSVENFLFPTL